MFYQGMYLTDYIFMGKNDSVYATYKSREGGHYFIKMEIDDPDVNEL